MLLNSFIENFKLKNRLEEVWSWLFDNDTGFDSSFQGRSHVNIDSPSLVYGESSLNSIYGIIKELRRLGVFAEGKKLNLVDLGAGVGNVVITLAHSGFFEKCTGVELLKEMYEKALDNREKYFSSYGSREIDFWNSDIVKFDLSNFDVIYLNMILNHEMRDILLEKVRSECRDGTIIIASIVPFRDDKEIHLLHSKRYRFHWGKSTMYVSRFERCRKI